MLVIWWGVNCGVSLMIMCLVGRFMYSRLVGFGVC